MTLATRCPHCQTTFRVAHDQLKLRAGLVRCGACKEIFNGVEHLLRPEETQQVLASAKPKAVPPQVDPSAAGLPAQASFASPATPSETQRPPLPSEAVEKAEVDEAESDDLSSSIAAEENARGPAMPPAENISPVGETRPASAETAPAESDFIDPLQRMTLMDFTAFDTHGAREESDKEIAEPERISHAEDAQDHDAESNTQDELSQAIDDLTNKPWRRNKSRGATDDPSQRGKTEPNFMARARRQKRYGKATRITMGIGSAILLIALLMQSVFVFRDAIAANLPEYRPVLTELCARLGCQVKLPAQIDKVSIESSELQSLPSSPNKFTLAALLRNQATSDQAWPYFELTLNDMNEKPVARKVFQPRDYLASPQDIASGLPAQSEQQVKLSFELLQLKASGYRLYLFYP